MTLDGKTTLFMPIPVELPYYYIFGVLLLFWLVRGSYRTVYTVTIVFYL